MKHILARHPGLASVLRNGAWQSAMVGLQFAIKLGYVLAISVFLGPQGYGHAAYGQTWYLAFLPFILLGMETILPREIGADPHRAAALLQRSLSLVLALALPVGALALGLVLIQPHSGNHGLAAVLAVITLALLPRVVQHWCRCVLIGYERGATEAKLVLLFRGGEAAVGTLALALGGGLAAFALIHLLSWLAYAVTCLRLIHRDIAPLRMAPSLCALPGFWREHLLLMLQFAGGFALLNGALFAYRFLQPDAAAFGQFALAFIAATYVATFFTAFDAATAPILSRSFHRADGKDRPFTLAASLALLVLSAALCWPAAQLAPPLMLALLGETYAPAAALLPGLLWWVPCYVAASPLISLLHARRRNGLIIGAFAVGVSVLAASVLLAPENALAARLGDALLYAMLTYYAASLAVWAWVVRKA